MPLTAEAVGRALSGLDPTTLYGEVTSVMGMMLEVGGIEKQLHLGGQCRVQVEPGRVLPCEVVGFRHRRALLMPFGSIDGIALGCRVLVSTGAPKVWPTDAWLGRMVNALGEPVDGLGPLPSGTLGVPIKTQAPTASERARMGGKIDLGVRVLNTFLTCVEGQRLGIFAGSGVGKSSLLGTIAKATNADVSVIGLIGERGREVMEFVDDVLGPEGLARSVVVVATGDEAPLMRRQAAHMTIAIGEYFRTVGRSVLCMMDSLTRFAMAQREIGLSAGEPPTTKGYPPTTFVELARLLERAGPGRPGEGQLTGLFTVLVDGGDHDEPISDAVRGIVDGHIVLERAIAERGRFPSVNVLKSVSRAMPHCNTDAENALVRRARGILSTYEDMAELIRLGAYKAGTDPKVDESIALYEPLEGFIAQQRGEISSLAEGYQQLAALLGQPWPAA